MHHAHAAPTAAAGGLDDHRIADVARDADVLRHVLGQRLARARHAGNTGGAHGLDGGNLVAHQANGFGPRADEDETALLHALGEVGVFRQEAVTRMDRHRIGHFRRADHGRDIEIGMRRLGQANADRLVGQPHVFEVAVDGGMHRHRLDAEFAAGP